MLLYEVLLWYLKSVGRSEAEHFWTTDNFGESHYLNMHNMTNSTESDKNTTMDTLIYTHILLLILSMSFVNLTLEEPKKTYVLLCFLFFLNHSMLFITNPNILMCREWVESYWLVHLMLHEEQAISDINKFSYLFPLNWME